MSFEIRTVYVDTPRELAIAKGACMGNREIYATGNFAKLYKHGDDQIMKISGGDDLGFLEYLKTIAGLGISNRYLPEVTEVIHYRFPDKVRASTSWFMNWEFIVTYMEKLKQPPKFGRCTYDERGNLLQIRGTPVQKFAERLRSYIEGPVENISKLRLEHQELVVLLKIAYEGHLNSSTPNGYQNLDLHAGNVMQRGKGFVVTDPLA